MLPPMVDGYQRVIPEFEGAAMRKSDQTWIANWIDAVAEGSAISPFERLPRWSDNARCD
jgi:hypothetical protein